LCLHVKFGISWRCHVECSVSYSFRVFFSFGWVSSGITLTPLCFHLLHFLFGLCCDVVLLLFDSKLKIFWVFGGFLWLAVMCVGFFYMKHSFSNEIWLGVVLVFGRCSCLIVIMHEAEYCQLFFISPLSVF
jgi:hypothetical protein